MTNRESFVTRRSTYALLLIGVMVVALSFFLKAAREQQDIRQKAVPATSVSLSPTTIQVSPGQEFPLDILINTGNNNVTSVDLLIHYDQVSLEYVDIHRKGDFFPVDLGEISGGGGSAQIKLGASVGKKSDVDGDGVSDDVVFAEVVFRVIADVQPGQVIGTTVDVVDPHPSDRFGLTYVGSTDLEDRGKNVLQSTTDTAVSIYEFATSPTPTPIPSPTPAPSSTPTPAPTATPGAPQTTPTPNPSGCDLPSAPTSLFASTVSTSQIYLSWNAASGASYYGIVYGTSSGRYTWGASDVGNVTNFTVSQLATNTTYYFAVFSVNNCGSSSYSNEASARTETAIGGEDFSEDYIADNTADTGETLSQVEFVPIDPELPAEEVIPFLAAKPRASVVAQIPRVSVPPEFAVEKPKSNPLVSPLGGVLLIIVSIFLAIFLFRMRE